MKNSLISYDPSNGEPIGHVQATPTEEIPEVVQRAKKAAGDWIDRGLDERLSIIQNTYAQAEPHVNELAELLCREMGKDLQRSSGEVSGVVFGGPYIAKEARNAFEPHRVGGEQPWNTNPWGLWRSFHRGTIPWPWPTI